MKRIRSKHPFLPVLVITGRGDVPLTVKALKAGATDFIEKPFEQEILLARVQSALQDYKRHADEDKLNADLTERVASLSRRERQVLEGIVEGKSNKAIGRERGISQRTVEVFRSNVMTKMQATSLSQVVRMAMICKVDRHGPEVSMERALILLK